MSRFLNEQLQSFHAYVPGEQPKDMARLIKLNTNESPYPPSPKVAEAIRPEAIQSLRLYSDLSAAALNRALADDLSVAPECILCANGSDEIIYFAMLAFGGQGVQFADITYGFYKVWANLLGIEQRVTPLGEDYTLDVSAYLGNDRMILIANPNAPTGIALRLCEIERVLSANPDRVVLIDEAYVDFGAESAVSLLGAHENLIVCRTFSKSRQLAGARLGFAVASPALVEDLNKMRYAINPYNVNTLTQLAGVASVLDSAYFEATRKRIIATRDWTCAALCDLGFSVLESSANFLFVRPAPLSGAAYTQALRQHGILVRWFDQPRIRDYVRITIGTDAQMQTLIQATKQIIGGETP